MSEAYRNATSWLCDIVEDAIVDGRLDFPPSSFEDMHLAHLVSVDSIRVGHQTWFSIGKEDAERMLDLAQDRHHYFDAVLRICAANVRSFQPLPPCLAELAGGFLAQEIKRRRARGGERNRDWLEKAYLYSLGLAANLRFGLTLTRNDVKAHDAPTESASDAVAEALTICGRKTNFAQIKSLFVHEDYERLRDEHQLFLNTWETRKELRAAIGAMLQDSDAAGSEIRLFGPAQLRSVLSQIPPGDREESQE